MSRAPLIAVEGIDGAGTTTLVANLCRELRSRGMAVHRTREPSDGPVGRLLREMLTGKHQPVDDVTLGLLFAADRADHVQREVDPELAAGRVVVSDRWYHSSLAYQGAGPRRRWIRELNCHAPAPALTLFVSITPEQAAQRRAQRGGDDELFDAIETQKRVAAGYLEVIDELRSAGENIELIDGSVDADAVLAAALPLALAVVPR